MVGCGVRKYKLPSTVTCGEVLSSSVLVHESFG